MASLPGWAHTPLIGTALACSGKAAATAVCAIWPRYHSGRSFIRDLPGTLVSAPICTPSAEEIAELEKLSGRSIFVPPGLDQKK